MLGGTQLHPQVVEGGGHGFVIIVPPGPVVVCGKHGGWDDDELTNSL